MGLFDASFSPYGGGLLGSLGINDLAGLVRQYGGYGKNDPNDIPGIEPQFSAASPTQPNIPAPPPTNIVDAPGQLTRPDSFLRNLFTGPFNAPLPPNAASPYDEAGFGGYPNAPQQQTAGVPLPQPRPAGPQPGAPLNILPPNGNAAPQEAALPPNAQLTQGQAPQQQPQVQPLPRAEPGFGDRMMAGAANFTTGGNPIAGIFNSINGLMTGQRTDAAGMRSQNQAQMTQALYGALTQRGIPPQQAFGIAQAAANDPKLAEALLPQALGLKPPATVEGVIAERMSRQGLGPQGKPGSPQSGGIDDGLDALRKLEEAKARGTAGGKYTGETQATAEMNLPSAVAQAKEALRLAGELRTHKGRDNPVFWHGKASAYLPDSAIPGNTDARDAVGILNQIKGGAFLEAFKTLKGGGQITEVEGKKATDAIARMDRSQSKAEFDRALSDYEGVIKLGVDRANQMAGRPAPNGFKGNSEWQQVQPGVRIRQVQ